jgi:[phosphatase 2A protein]-leucine-carboxy methyltransferase
MSPTASSMLVQWFVDYFSSLSTSTTAAGGGVLGSIVYEMFGLNDSFGKEMVRNLKVTPNVSGLAAY